ncbi:MAG: SCP-2 sterol transfer family protein [Pseudomonadota bacterium]
MKNLIKITAIIGMFSCMGLAQAAELFSDAWMKAFMEEWNKETEALVEPLSKLDNPFTANIAYGFYGDKQPKGVLSIENGRAVSAGAYNGETLKWDLRAKPEKWEKWLKDGKVGKFDMAKPAMWGGLGFEVGNYSAMMKDPSMMGPFMKSFEVMGRVNVE